MDFHRVKSIRFSAAAIDVVIMNDMTPGAPANPAPKEPDLA